MNTNRNAAGGRSDGELAGLANGGDSHAFALLAERYKPFLRSRVGRYAAMVGADAEDFYQEGMLALFRAVKGYDMQAGASFGAYADTCIRNAMITAIKTHFKSAAGKGLLSLEGMDEQWLHQKSLDPREGSPEDRYLDGEAESFLLRRMKDLLSPYERQVLTLYLRGNTYQQISRVLSTSTKAVDNALQRVRRKLRPELTAGGPSRLPAERL